MPARCGRNYSCLPLKFRLPPYYLKFVFCHAHDEMNVHQAYEIAFSFNIENLSRIIRLVYSGIA
jgi:hypothetical protein